MDGCNTNLRVLIRVECAFPAAGDSSRMLGETVSIKC